MAYLTYERLIELLSYDHHTGEFRWLKKNSKKTTIGSVAGCICKAHGYRLIGIDGVIYRANRLAFLYMNCCWPKHRIDHINRDRNDDRWENLREATHPQNLANSGTPRHNTSGFKGVSWHRQSKMWVAAITTDGRKKHLGLFEKKEEAAVAYHAAAIKIYGPFVASQQ